MVQRRSLGSSPLDEHVDTVERYGFDRKNFPVTYNGHKVSVLCNDAYVDDERLLFDFKLYCNRCTEDSTIAGRFPASDGDQFAHLVNAKVAVFATFKSTECV
jgi:hypothetical protein